MADPRILNEFKSMNCLLAVIAESLGNISASLSELSVKMDVIGVNTSLNVSSAQFTAGAPVEYTFCDKSCSLENYGEINCNVDIACESNSNKGCDLKENFMVEHGSSNLEPERIESNVVATDTRIDIPIASQEKDADDEVETIAKHHSDPKFTAFFRESIVDESQSYSSDVVDTSLGESKDGFNIISSVAPIAIVESESVATRRDGESAADFFKRVIDAGLLPSNSSGRQADSIQIDSSVEIDLDSDGPDTARSQN